MFLKSSRHDIDLDTKQPAVFKVLKVYRSACLLRQNDSFVSALAGGRSMLPLSFGVEAKNFNNISEGGQMNIDFSQSSGWDSRLMCPGLSAANKMPETLNGLLRGRAHSHRDFDRLTAGRLPEIIGAGEGLTPAGDDFTAGALNGSAYFAPRFFEKIRKTVMDNIHKTSRLSRHFLTLAADRRAGEDLKALLWALCGGSRDTVENAGRRMLGWGSSSGYYMLKGILWSLKQIN